MISCGKSAYQTFGPLITANDHYRLCAVRILCYILFQVSDLISQLNTKVLNVPDQLKKVAEELQKESAKKDELLSMKSLNEKIKSFKEKGKPKLEERIADVETVSIKKQDMPYYTQKILTFQSNS